MECEHVVTQYDGLILIRFNLLIIALHHVQLFPGFGFNSMLGNVSMFMACPSAEVLESLVLVILIIYIFKLFSERQGEVFWSEPGE